jgi:hypothetical protein
VRSILNKALFTRLYIDGGRVTDQELAEPFNMLHEAYTIWREHQATRRAYHRQGAVSAATTELDASTQAADEAAWQRLLQTASSADLPEETGATSENNITRLLALTLADAGSSKRVMVGVTRLELATSRPPAVRATNCATPRSIKENISPEQRF